ncbi:hypothetical protein [uncultured Aquimarina sp.]|uniref:glucosamine inositolphosphorylceramide transferase family protein n=1 Tax=uncultured Aquimarina sp. TaxID=575652 RepID=UPI00263A0BE8|nr:hypothetical protein [uncultured Aquimarina sp.]
MIKYGIMIGSDFALSDWQLKCIEEIRENSNTQLSLLIVNDNKNQRVVKSKNIFFKIYRKFFFRAKSIKKKNITEVVDIENMKRIYCKVNKKGFSEYFHEDDVAKVKAENLDFILRFSFGIIRGEILESSRLGVWSYHHGDELKYRGTPPGFWEIYNEDPVSGTILQKLTHRLDGGVILRKSHYKTVAHSYSKNLDNLYYNSAELVALVCKEISVLNNDFFEKSSKTNAKIRYEPNNLEFLRFLRVLISKKMSNIFQILLFEKWNVGIVNSTFEEVLERGIVDDKVSWVKGLKKEEFLADPFDSYSDDNSFFAEYYNYYEDKGKLVSVRPDNKTCSIDKMKPILENDYHLSYPYTFKDDNINYLLPENSGSFKQHLISFSNPDFINKQEIIKDKALVDSSIIKYNNKYWLFCAQKNDLPDTKLFLYHSSKLDGEWMPHIKNPVKIDINSSRPGGSFFTHNDELYRSTQNCSRNYGGSLTICKIKKLSETDFQEEVVKELMPIKPYKKGLHTMSSFGDKLLIDGRQDLFIWKGFLNAIQRRIT